MNGTRGWLWCRAVAVALALLASFLLETSVCSADRGDPVPADGTTIPLPDVAGPYLPSAEAWPARIAPAGDAATGLAIRLPEERAIWAPLRIGLLRPGNEGVDQLREWLGDEWPSSVALEGINAFVPRFIVPPPGRASALTGQFWLHVSLREAGVSDRQPLLERTGFVALSPTGTETPRGVCLFMPGLFGTPEGIIDLTIRRLRRDGWMVVRMMAQSSRFTERAEYAIDPAALLDEASRPLADEIRNRVAECAYAVENVLNAVENADPRLRDLPRIAVGFSGGAMTLPTVVAREPDRYSAAVLIGGGAQFLLLITRSNYSNWIDAFRLQWTSPPTPQQEAALSNAYLSQNALDSFHTAAALRNKPVLFIVGEHDRAVPASLGRVLWERIPQRHERAEFWSRPSGHELLFMGLPRELDAISAWIDRAVPVPDATHAAPDAKPVPTNP